MVIGGAIAYFFASQNNKKHTEESNRQADLAVQEARLTAKRIEDEAAVKAQKIVGNAEAENERIKQQKIQEAREHAKTSGRIVVNLVFGRSSGRLLME